MGGFRSLSVLSSIAQDREESITEAQEAYGEAYTAYMAFMDMHPPAHRKPDEQTELNRLESICTWAKYRYDNAKFMRYRIK